MIVASALDTSVEFTLVPRGSVHGERANFTLLVLFCIDASGSESRRIFHRFSRSSLLRTGPNPKFQQKRAKIFVFLQKFRKILQNFVQVLRNVNETSPEFRQNFRKSEHTYDPSTKVRAAKHF